MEPKVPKSYAAIYAAAFNRIANGQYRPTHRIAIAPLSESLGVSTTPVREALRQLVGRDLLVERHREGFYLAPLNRRTIQSLYSAHGLWMDRILQTVAEPVPQPRRHRSLWRLFEGRATSTGDAATIAVRRYLDNRLAVLRRHEAGVLGDMADRARAMSDALGDRNITAALRVSRSFHARCEELADRLAFAFDNQG